MARLIDANKLQSVEKEIVTGKVRSPFEKDHTAIIRVFEFNEIRNAPTVDAVPVVRCKDCKHRSTDNFNPPKDKNGYYDYSCPYICRDPYYTLSPYDDFFCGHGERKDGE